jgi:hypothetical protein
MEKRARKVSFYYICLEEEEYIKEKNTTRITILNSSLFEKAFEKVYKHMKELSNGHRACNVSTSSNDYVIEVYNYADHKFVAKIGQQNSSDTVSLRDSKTLEAQDVPMSPSQLLELYTFFLVDLETGILTYIGLNGPPKLSAIKQLFDDTLSEEMIRARLSVIMTDDILELLTKKDIISKITMSIAIPNDDLLGDVIGVSKKEFDILGDLKTKTVTLNLVANRNKNIFKSNRDLSSFVSSAREKYGERIKRINVNARNYNEGSQTYDLMQYNFTKKVIINPSDFGTTEIGLIEIMKKTYYNNRREIIKYIKNIK